jgi:hypothetical protein
MSDLKDRLTIGQKDLEAVNNLVTNTDNKVVQDLINLIEQFGGIDEINKKAEEARDPDNLMRRLKEMNSPYVADIEWLIEQRDNNAFVSMDEYCTRHGKTPSEVDFSTAVTLEISALQFFPWLIAEARQAIEKQELMPGRIIRVRNMVEQVEDDGIL